MSRSRISNPKKLRKIEKLLGRAVKDALYRGGCWYSCYPTGGHFFFVRCVDGAEFIVGSKLDKFESLDEECNDD